MAFALGCFSGCVGLLGLGANAVGDRIEQSNATHAAIAVAGSQRVSDALALTHAGALVVCSFLAVRARPRPTALLRVVLFAGVPLALLTLAWNLSRQWTLGGLHANGGGGSRGLALVALWSLAWSAAKISFFVWAGRYLARELAAPRSG